MKPNQNEKFHDEYSVEEARLIESNFKRLKDIHYLDHAGATQYAEEQMQEIYSNLVSNVHCNPHTSKATEDLIDQVRYRILHSFNTTTDDYSVIFTSGATSSLRIVAETFDFSNNGSGSGCFGYLRDNHTSVLGLREIVKTDNINCIELSEFMQNRFDKRTYNDGNLLYVYPAQCNFSGFKYPLETIETIQTLNNTIDLENSNRYICLDAACFVSTNKLDLKKWRPDFVCLSFYKVFGYPTGLGALIVSRRGENVLRKIYYGGGTVKISLSNSTGWHRKRDQLHERFEDGTIPYLSIISLLAGYNTIEKCIPGQTMDRISKHCYNLAKYLYDALSKLRYKNGERVVKLYHDSDFSSSMKQGGIVNFNVLHEDGSYVGFFEVANLAQLHNIYLRAGCFCNPGACQRHLNLTDETLKSHFKAGHICGDDNDLIDGIPTGSIRISIGYMTTRRNIEAVIQFIENCFANKERLKYLSPVEPKKSDCLVSSPISLKQNLSHTIDKSIPKTEYKTTDVVKTTSIDRNRPKNSIKLHEICIYPIKSCAPFRVDGTWIVNQRGLKYDREWMIVRSSGIAMTQKIDPKLCLIQPKIDENENTLSLSFPYAKTIKISLRLDVNNNMINNDSKAVSMFCQSKVCGDRIDGTDCGNEVADWLSDVLCTPGLRLIQQNYDDKRTTKVNGHGEQAISLSNQAQFLLINVASVEWLTKKVNDWLELDDCSENVLQNTIDRFRANLIVESDDPLEEMDWKSIKIGNFKLIATGPCTRCQMICIDQSTGEKTTEPLQTIAREFNGKMRFGVYLCQTNDISTDAEHSISCHDMIMVEK